MIQLRYLVQELHDSQTELWFSSLFLFQICSALYLCCCRVYNPLMTSLVWMQMLKVENSGLGLLESSHEGIVWVPKRRLWRSAPPVCQNLTHPIIGTKQGLLQEIQWCISKCLWHTTSQFSVSPSLLYCMVLLDGEFRGSPELHPKRSGSRVRFSLPYRIVVIVCLMWVVETRISLLFSLLFLSPASS